MSNILTRLRDFYLTSGLLECKTYDEALQLSVGEITECDLVFIRLCSKLGIDFACAKILVNNDCDRDTYVSLFVNFPRCKACFRHQSAICMKTEKLQDEDALAIFLIAHKNIFDCFIHIFEWVREKKIHSTIYIDIPYTRGENAEPYNFCLDRYISLEQFRAIYSAAKDCMYLNLDRLFISYLWQETDYQLVRDVYNGTEENYKYCQDITEARKFIINLLHKYQASRLYEMQDFLMGYINKKIVYDDHFNKILLGEDKEIIALYARMRREITRAVLVQLNRQILVQPAVEILHKNLIDVILNFVF